MRTFPLLVVGDPMGRRADPRRRPGSPWPCLDRAVKARATLPTWTSSCRPTTIRGAWPCGRGWPSTRARAGGSWPRRATSPRTGRALGPRRRPHPPAPHRRGAAGGRRAPPVEHDRHRLGRADDPPRRHRGAEGALPLPAARRRGDLVPALQRARRGVRPRLAGHPGRARRRRVGGQRPEDLDVAGASTRRSASSSPAPTPTPRSTRASRTSSARWTPPASRSGRSSR